MALPVVAQGDPHVSAHNAERLVINSLQDLSDAVFVGALRQYIMERLSDIDVAGTGTLKKNRDVELMAENQFVSHNVVVDDGTPSADWPNRFSFEFKPNAGNTIGQHLTAWFNEYGEFRCTPAKASTVPFRAFTKELDTDADHDPAVPVIEMVYSRNVRTAIFGVMANGTLYTSGPIERRVPSGPTLKTGFLILGAADPVPVNTPPNTLIVRTA